MARGDVMGVPYPCMKHHFARVAQRYRQLRELDVTVVRRVARIIRRLAKSELRIVILDVGSGTGRYLESVLAESGLETTHQCCAVRYDVMRAMFGGIPVSSRLPSCAIRSVVGLAESLPFTCGTINAVLTFNAIHHFIAAPFLAEVGRVLRPGGKVVIYTRTPEQNRGTVWGRFFPGFAEKEDRLLTETELAAAMDQAGAFGRAELCVIPWRVETSLSRLIDQARGGAYSTFEFYSRREFEDAVKTFEARVLEHFEDSSRIVVRNDHVLTVATAGSMP